MLNSSKFLSVICAGMVVFGSAATTPVMAGEAVLQQAKAAIQVKGVVLDTSNEPVLGATVVEVGNPKNGTLTGVDGSFTLSVASGASLKISYIGYKTVTVKAVAGDMTITLNEDSELLDDVVVVGYGTQRKKLVTGSTLHVDAADDDTHVLMHMDLLGRRQTTLGHLGHVNEAVLVDSQVNEGAKLGHIGHNTVQFHTLT